MLMDKAIRKTLGNDGVAVLIGCLVLAVVVLVWSVVTGWPLILWVLGLAITTVFAKGRRKKFGLITLVAFVFMLVVAVIQSQQGIDARGTTSKENAVALEMTASSPSPVAPVVLRETPPVPTQDPSNLAQASLTVTRVIDGDTFEIAGGARVRVFGIDSCEIATTGGKAAKSDATGLLAGGVSLRSEPGVDKDQHGRLLRYVTVRAGDFGELMVVHYHTAVYAKKLAPKYSANAGYIDMLRKQDPGGRNCAGPPPAAAAPVAVSGSSSDDDSSYVGRKAKGAVCRRTIFC